MTTDFQVYGGTALVTLLQMVSKHYLWDFNLLPLTSDTVMIISNVIQYSSWVLDESECNLSRLTEMWNRQLAKIGHSMCDSGLFTLRLKFKNLLSTAVSSPSIFVSPLFFWQAAESKSAALGPILLVRTYPGAKWRWEIQLSSFSSSTCAPRKALKTHIFLKWKIVYITLKCCRGSTRLSNHPG